MEEAPVVYEYDAYDPYQPEGLTGTSSPGTATGSASGEIQSTTYEYEPVVASAGDSGGTSGTRTASATTQAAVEVQIEYDSQPSTPVTPTPSTT